VTRLSVTAFFQLPEAVSSQWEYTACVVCQVLVIPPNHCSYPSSVPDPMFTFACNYECLTYMSPVEHYHYAYMIL